MSIAERYAAEREKLAAVQKAANRADGSVRLVAVSKTVGIEGVEEAFAAGARDFGENRIDSLLPKFERFPNATWHFIGNIQSRRIPEIVRCASLIHSLYQESHAVKINKAAADLEKVQDVLIEVNVSGESSKSGVAPDELHAMVEACDCLPYVRVCGLMTMAPQGDLAFARICFERLRELLETERAQMMPEKASVFNELSMGMSEDWEEAVPAGATMIRIGRAIFSDQVF